MMKTFLQVLSRENLLSFLKRIQFFIQHREERMKNEQIYLQCKIEQPEAPMEFPRRDGRSEYMLGSPFYNQQPHYGPNLSLNNSSLPYKKRRNSSLRLKNEPSDQKMKKIDQKRGRYKRSTNNSHKKYTGVARRLLLKYLKEPEINRFETVYQSLKNSRTYYFIILAHVKFLLAPKYIKEIQDNFIMVMRNKMDFYNKEMSKTNNRNFINFRLGEIAEIEFALRAFELYFNDFVEEAVEIIYKKDKTIIIKKNQYEQTIQIIKQLQENLQNRVGDPSNRYSRKIIPKISIQGGRESHHVKKEESLNSQENEEEEYHREREITRRQVYSKYSTSVCPLRELEHSYPYFESFFPIVFPYTENSYPRPPSLAPIFSQMQFNFVEQELRDKQLKISMDSKTAVTKFESFRQEPFILTPCRPLQDQI